MLNKNIIIGAGAVFAMFFGSGNIVLPLQLGQRLHESWFSAFIGFCISGVFIPLAGLIAVVLLNGNSDDFFKPLPKKIAFLLQFFVLSLNGPFGIVPRCSTVAFGGISSFFSNASMEIFSFFFCLIVAILIMTKDRIMPIISRVLTPIKISCLFIMVLIGIIYAPGKVSISSFSMNSFIEGGLYGYLTMDLGGAIFFASLVMEHLSVVEKSQKKDILKKGLQISFLSTILLIIIYLAFFILSVGYKNHIINIPGEKILPTIIAFSLGNFSNYLICATIIIACMTTAVAFLSVWVIFIAKYTEKYNISYKSIVILGILITYFVSLFGYQSILDTMIPILKLIYPILILMAFWHIKKSISEA